MDKLPLVIEEIILEYVNQLIFTEKYAKVIRQLKDEVVYECEEGTRFSHLCFNGNEIHYYQSINSDLMVIRRGTRGTHYFYNNEVVYLFGNR